MRRIRFWYLAPVLLLTLLPQLVFAQSSTSPCLVTSDNIAKGAGAAVIPFTPEIDLPGIFSGQQNLTGASIGQYIRALFIFFVWIVGLLAVVMVIYGGIRWVAAAGNPGRITSARETVQNAIIGVILALTSVVLLNTINPQLTQLTNLDIHAVSPCELAFINEAVRAAGPTISECTAKSLNDTADTFYTRSTGGPFSGFNTIINTAGKSYSVDPILLKALILIEAPKKNGAPISGPTAGNESNTSTRHGSAYGFGQIVAGSLVGYAKDADVTLPAVCDHDVSKLRKSTGELIDACANALDQNPQLQLNLMAGGLAATIQANQVSSKPAVLAMAWHLGQKGATDFFQGSDNLTGTTKEQATAYLKLFNTSYTKTCTASVVSQANDQFDNHPGN